MTLLPLSDRTQRWASRILVAALLAAYWLLAVSSVREKSVTFDETAHLVAGYSYWALDDYRLHPENGILPQRWLALPLIAGDFKFPATDTKAWDVSHVWALGSEFLYFLGDDADAMLLRARAFAAFWGVALGLLVFCWARELYGPAGGWISLVLFVFCPTMLANGSLATSDLPAALFFSASVWGLWKLLHRVSLGNLLFSVAAVAGLVLTKVSGVLIVPIAVLLVIVRLIPRRPLVISWRGGREIHGRLAALAIFAGLALAITLAVWGAVWAGYGFRYETFKEAPKEGDELYEGGWSTVFDKPGFTAAAIAFARDHRLLPEAYLYGAAFVLRHSHRRSSFLNGGFTREGRVAFFPYCLLVKTPLPLFGMIGLAAWAVIRGRRKLANAPPAPLSVSGLYDHAPLLILLAVYWGVALTSAINIGHRHLVPTYPAMLILAGGTGLWFRRARAATPHSQGEPVAAPVPGSTEPVAAPQQIAAPAGPSSEAGASFRLARGAILVLILAFVAESLLIWPNYLSYFNAIAGGPRNGYKHLVDSSLDWGQDLPGLKSWLTDHELPSAKTPVYLAYFGTGSPDFYGIQALYLPSFAPRRRSGQPPPLRGGVYCISATMLQTVYTTYPGPWTYEYEVQYQKCCRFVEQYERDRLDPSWPERRAQLQADPQKWKEFLQIFEQFEQARFARLCAFLRKREPDDQIGCSILIYRLSDEDVKQALTAKVL